MLNQTLIDQIDKRVKENNLKSEHLAIPSSPQQFAQRRFRIIKASKSAVHVPQFKDKIDQILNDCKNQNSHNKMAHLYKPIQQQEQSLINIPPQTSKTENQQLNYGEEDNIIQTNQHQTKNIINSSATNIQNKPITHQIFQNTNAGANINSNHQTSSTIKHQAGGSPIKNQQNINTLFTKPEVSLFNNQPLPSSLFSKPIQNQIPFLGNPMKTSIRAPSSAIQPSPSSVNQSPNQSKSIFSENKQQSLKQPLFGINPSINSNLFSKPVSNTGLFKDPSVSSGVNSNQLLFNNSENSMNQPKIIFNMKVQGVQKNKQQDINNLLKNSTHKQPTKLFDNSNIISQPPKATQVQQPIKNQQVNKQKSLPQNIALQPQKPQQTVNSNPFSNITSKPDNILQQNTQKQSSNKSLFSNPKQGGNVSSNLFGPTSTIFNNSNNTLTYPSPTVNNIQQQPKIAESPKVVQSPQKIQILTKPQPIAEIPFPTLQTNQVVAEQKNLFSKSNPFAPSMDRPNVSSVQNVSLFSTSNKGNLFSAPSTTGNIFQSINKSIFSSQNNTSQNLVPQSSGNVFQAMSNNSFGQTNNGNIFSTGFNPPTTNIFSQNIPKKAEQENEDDEDDDGPIVAQQPQVTEGQMMYEYKSQMQILAKYSADLFKKNQDQSINNVIVSLQKSSTDKLYLYVRTKQTKNVIYTGMILPNTVCTLMKSNRNNARLSPVFYVSSKKSAENPMNTIRIKFNEVPNAQNFQMVMKSNQNQ